jgi:hypothetical protein
MKKHQTPHAFLILIPLILVMAPNAAIAQITISDGGNISIGDDTPTSTEQVRIECESCTGTDRAALYSRVTGGSQYGYGRGVWGVASGPYMAVGVYGQAINGYANYGIYGAASGGHTNWAGYFSGNVYTTGSYSSSDVRLKKNIRPLESTLAKLMNLQPVRYEFLNEEELKSAGLPSLNASGSDQIGLLAQQLATIFPELVVDVEHPVEVSGGGELSTTKAVNYNALIVVLITAVQEQQARIEALEQALKNE